MGHFVLELFFDAETEQSIRNLWAQADALPGCPPPERGHARPHLSVASTPAIDTLAFGRLLREFAASTRAMPISFASVSAFASKEGVVFLAPVVTVELLCLHEYLTRMLQQCGATISTVYAPDDWVPHCTIACGFPPMLQPRIIELCLSGLRPNPGRIEQIGLVEMELAQPDTTEYLSFIKRTVTD